MNNQVKLIDADKLMKWLEESPEAAKFWLTQVEPIEKYDLIEDAIGMGKFDPDTPPVPTIGCSECDYKGYFEYETGVVDEGTQIKEIAKEPCDCVIDRVPTIKPGDTRNAEKILDGVLREIDKLKLRTINPAAFKRVMDIINGEVVE
ncbi:hypothetical protein BBD41_03240 [Paenibacillus ihbetae]|uniref:Uncharacterized protein n=1 Tax=Paenibacillus ihbetae TaxID=1870820 RepID=A0A1B2DVD9_9BACL|nr:hypothetical protein [Paenibacillus ihbetae]ANY71674.1 hypothetical protein BBD41_03240 [Paenibacillus ihbetae]